jgi:hypothetical protein
MNGKKREDTDRDRKDQRQDQGGAGRRIEKRDYNDVTDWRDPTPPSKDKDRDRESGQHG